MADPTPELAALSTEPSPRVRPWRGRFAKFVTACVILEAALFAFAWALPFRPTSNWAVYHYVAPISFFVRVFQLHAGILALIAAVVLLMLKWKRVALFALLLAIVGIGPEAWQAYGPRSETTSDTSGIRLRVASVNLLKYLSNTDMAAQVIEQFDADVVSVQEITPTQDGTLTPRISGRYPYRIVQPDTGFNGLAVYSKYPITLEEAGLPDGLRWLRVSLHLPKTDVAFYAIHLAPPQAIKMQRQNRWQVGELIKRAETEQRPMILAGDFNATFLTPQMRALQSAGFIDAHYASTHGRGTTWPTPVGSHVIPAVRIDTVYTRGNIAADSSHVGPRFGSDHLPIVVDLRVN